MNFQGLDLVIFRLASDDSHRLGEAVRRIRLAGVFLIRQSPDPHMAVRVRRGRPGNAEKSRGRVVGVSESLSQRTRTSALRPSFVSVALRVGPGRLGAGDSILSGFSPASVA